MADMVVMYFVADDRQQVGATVPGEEQVHDDAVLAAIGLGSEKGISKPGRRATFDFAPREEWRGQTAGFRDQVHLCQ